MAVRNTSKGEVAAKPLREGSRDAQIGVWELDQVSDHGWEKTLQISYLSAALLAFLLLPVLKASGERLGSGPYDFCFVDPSMVSSTNLSGKMPCAAVKGKESHGGFDVNWEIYPFPAKMYTPEGSKTVDRV
ncbi:hypothetical protein SLS53_004268 [Cytospora paraplurivora]|uniref:Uncharacterized protein n=1 Tax=Cytospora paraplurivora TaxID=2898453 RepID=A0AAN9UGQ9_9PEZI